MQFPPLRLLYSRRVVVATDSKRRLTGEDSGSLIFFFRLSETVTMRFGMIQRRLLVLLAATMRRGVAHGYP
jgi:hypothetical protein